MEDKQLSLQNKIEENLYEFFAKDINSARDVEIFASLAKALRLFIGMKWHETLYNTSKDKRVYILSFENSLGNRLTANAVRLGVFNEMIRYFHDKDIDFTEISDQEYESALGFGELGVLTSIMLDSFASTSSKAYAYGLRYRKGMLKQEIVNGRQVEKPDDWKVYKNPWEHEKSFNHLVDLGDYSVKAIPYDVPIVGSGKGNIITLRLWKSESVEDINFKSFSEGHIQEAYKNINRANSIVEFLYPQEDSFEGKKLRLSQEIFFASACIQDILKKYKKYINDDIRNLPLHNVIQLNDIHPTFATLLLIRSLIDKYGLTLDEAIEISRKTFIFINVSLLEENFEKWDLSLLNAVRPDLLELIDQIDKKLKAELMADHVQGEMLDALSIIRHGFVESINIIFYLVKNVYVLGDHQEKFLKEVYLPFHYKHYADKICKLALGFNSLDYLEVNNRKLFEFFKNNTLRSSDFEDMKYYELLAEIKRKQKEKVANLLFLQKGIRINPKSIYNMNFGVFHESKRQLLSALSLAFLYYKLKKEGNIDMPQRTYFFAGKSYPSYYFAKEIISFIIALQKLINDDYSINDKIKVVFVEDYNIKKANLLIPACDIYENLGSIAKTSIDLDGIKFLVNGSVMISSQSYLASRMQDDGWDEGIYLFGDPEDEVIRETKNPSYNLNRLFYENPILGDFVDFYRYLPKDRFPYDINIIVNTLFNYNDGFHVFKELLSFTEVHERACHDYLNLKSWQKKVLTNIEFSLDFEMDRATLTNITNYWRQ